MMRILEIRNGKLELYSYGAQIMGYFTDRLQNYIFLSLFPFLIQSEWIIFRNFALDKNNLLSYGIKKKHRHHWRRRLYR